MTYGARTDQEQFVFGSAQVIVAFAVDEPNPFENFTVTGSILTKSVDKPHAPLGQIPRQRWWRFHARAGLRLV